MPRRKQASPPAKDTTSYRHPEADPATLRPRTALDQRGPASIDKVAVKVIDPRGNELFVVREIEVEQ